MFSKLRIGFDARTLGNAMTGVGNYTYNMICNSLELDHALQFIGFRNFSLREFGIAQMQALNANSTIQKKNSSGAIPPAGSGIKEFLESRLSRMHAMRPAYAGLSRHRFKRLTRSRPFDIFHAYNYIPPSDPGVPLLPVIYDLSFVRHPGTHPKERVKVLDKLPEVISKASIIQTISQFSKNELIKIFKCPADKIFVSSPAAASVFCSKGIDACKSDLDNFDLLYGQYFLMVGTLEPRKNLSTVVSAYSRLPAHHRAHFPLVIVGGKGWGNLGFPPELSNFMRQGAVRFLGRVTDRQLRSIYEGARLMLYPSIYEGFGMPVVEAFACGTPVAHSAETAMDEITGNMAQRIKAKDVDGWTSTLLMAIEQHDFSDDASRNQRIARARTFSWKTSALQVVEAYRKLT